MCFSGDYMMGWQQLKGGIVMGCSISPILFMVLLKCYSLEQGKWQEALSHRHRGRLTAMREDMDDVTSILQTAPCTTLLLMQFAVSLGKDKDQACQVQEPVDQKGSEGRQNSIHN